MLPFNCSHFTSQPLVESCLSMLSTPQTHHPTLKHAFPWFGAISYWVLIFYKINFWEDLTNNILFSCCHSRVILCFIIPWNLNRQYSEFPTILKSMSSCISIISILFHFNRYDSNNNDILKAKALLEGINT